MRTSLARHSVCILVTLFAASFVGTARSQESPTLTDALAELNSGHVFEAISTLKLLRQADSTPQVAFYLSGIYTELGKYETAYSYLLEAIRKDPKRGAYYHQLGLIRRYEGCRPEAIAAFTDALNIGVGTGEATVWRNIADTRVDLLEWDSAIDAYNHALRLQPGDARARLALGSLYVDRNNPERAVSELVAALKVATLPGLHATLGRAYRESGDSASAIAILKQGLDRDSSDQDSRYVLAQILLATGRTEEGRQAMEEYQQLQRRIDQTNAAFETAVGKAQAGDLDEAEKKLREALDLAPRYAPALQILGAVLLNRGKLQDALDVFQKALSVNPLNSETYFDMGAAFLQMNQLNDALERTRKALVIEEEDPRYYAQLAEVYSRMGRQEPSSAALEKAGALRAAPGFREQDPYASEGRRRDDSVTVHRICNEPVTP